MKHLVTIVFILSLGFNIFSQEKISYTNGLLQFDNNSYSIDSLVKMKKTAYIWEDWIAIKENKNGWGPLGGNIFLKFDSDKISYKEISNSWSSNKNILNEFENVFPLKIEKSGNTIYKVLGYCDSKLWFSIYENIMLLNEKGEYSYPKILGFVDLQENEFMFFTENDLKFSHFVKVVNLKDKIFLIGESVRLFEKELPQDKKAGNFKLYNFDSLSNTLKEI